MVEPELLQRDLEQAGVRLLDSVLERQCVAVDERSQPVVIEVRPQRVVNVTDVNAGIKVGQ